MVYRQELLIYICIRVSRDTYNRHGMSNMQLNDGRPGRMARGRELVVPPLMWGHKETVNVLVAAGADLNTQDRVCIVSTVCVY